MADPSVATMQKWLKDVTEVEERLYVVDDTIARLSRTLENLPQSYTVRKPTEYERKSFGECLHDALYSYGLLGSLLGLAGWLGVTLEGCSLRTVSEGLSVAFLGAIAGIVASTVVGAGYIYSNEERRAAQLNAKSRDEYSNTLAQAKAQLSRNKKARPVYAAELKRMQGVHDSLIVARNRLYATGYLDETYRGLVPVATMYGYLSTGRCTRVYGHGGVIDTFVHDTQFQLLCSRLDEIIERLDEIQMTQVALAESLHRANDEIRGMRGQISQLTDRVTDESHGIQKCIQYENDCNRWLAVVALNDYARR